MVVLATRPGCPKGHQIYNAKGKNYVNCGSGTAEAMIEEYMKSDSDKLPNIRHKAAQKPRSSKNVIDEYMNADNVPVPKPE
jgi:hypothetical protein